MTIEIISLSAVNGGADISVSVRISDGQSAEKRTLIILASQYAELRPVKGEISEEEFDAMDEAAEICAAVKRGTYILGYGACSECNMRLKLRSKGFSADTARVAARKLVELGYINERGDAEREAERCLAKYWGRQRIAAALYEKGYGADAVNNAMESLSRVDFARRCAELIRKKLRGASVGEVDKKKLFAALMRYGYSSSEIKNAFYIVENND